MIESFTFCKKLFRIFAVLLTDHWEDALVFRVKALYINNIVKIHFLLFALFSLGCGQKKAAESQSDPEGEISSMFSLAAQTHSIPKDFLLAIAYLESQIEPRSSSNIYGGIQKSIALEETAFGVNKQTLGLDPQNEENESLTAQINAYSKWLMDQTKDLGLKTPPRSNSERLDWIWQIARLHRSADIGTKNTRIIFARELSRILNYGFTWKNPNTAETIVLPKATPPVNISELPYKLNTQRAKIFSAIRLRFVTGGIFRPEQSPQGVEIVHCPLGLSACLELQAETVDGNAGNSVLLQAHYLIPQNDHFVDFPVQLRDHEHASARTGPNGSTVYGNKVVVMLTGMSGKLQNNKRLREKPDWFTPWQLQRMAEVVGDICEKIALTGEGSDTQKKWRECTTIDQGIKFHSSSPAQATWGDIANFDQDIFHAYLKKPDGLADATFFQFNQKNKEFQSGLVPIELRFPLNSKNLVLERLNDCRGSDESKRSKWEIALKIPVKSLNQYSVSMPFYRQGPNNDGAHFLRLKAWDSDMNLLGWSTEKLQIVNPVANSETNKLPPCSL